jgi:hypothetical protein
MDVAVNLKIAVSLEVAMRELGRQKGGLRADSLRKKAMPNYSPARGTTQTSIS